MNCIVIDDDKLTRNLLESYVKKTQTLKLCGSYSNPLKIEDILSQKNSIDLIFLDMVMPEISGIEFLKNIHNKNLQVIIISGYKGYALEAFEYNVTDYLLKPIDYNRFFKAVEKAYQRSSQSKPEKFYGKFYIKRDQAFKEIFFDDILYIKKTETGVTIFTSEKYYNTTVKFDDILSKLPKSLFRKVHSSYIINCEQISDISNKYVTVGHTDHEKNIPLELVEKEDILKKQILE